MNGTQQLPQGAQSGMPQGGFPQGGPPGGMGGRGMMGILPGGPLTGVVSFALMVITLIVLAIAFYKLFEKAGFTPAIGLLMLVPVVNLGVALYLAFAEWPVHQELARTKLLVASATPASTAVPAPVATPPEGPESAVPLTT